MTEPGSGQGAWTDPIVLRFTPRAAEAYHALGLLNRRLYLALAVVEGHRRLLAKDIDGLRYDEASVHSSLGWSAMSDFVEDAELVVVRKGRRPVAVIPKRAFASAAQERAFIQRLQGNLRPSS